MSDLLSTIRKDRKNDYKGPSRRMEVDKLQTMEIKRSSPWPSENTMKSYKDNYRPMYTTSNNIERISYHDKDETDYDRLSNSISQKYLYTNYHNPRIFPNTYF